MLIGVNGPPTLKIYRKMTPYEMLLTESPAAPIQVVSPRKLNVDVQKRRWKPV